MMTLDDIIKSGDLAQMKKVMTAIDAGIIGVPGKIYIETKDSMGKTPLYLACTYRKFEIVKFLVGLGADINNKNNDGNSPLMWSAQNGETEIVQYLCEHTHIDVNTQSKAENTALHYAAFDGHLAIVQILCQYGADVNIKNKNGHTPLMVAKLAQKDDIVNFLENESKADSYFSMMVESAAVEPKDSRRFSFRS